MPSANGSAYLEIEAPAQSSAQNFLLQQSTLKLSCAVHGPKPLSRTANFSPNLQISAHVKIAPFATRNRRGYIRDNEERDVGIHLETALKGVILADRYPKSAIDVVVTVLEAEEDGISMQGRQGLRGCGTMNLLAGCITVASAALAHARIDCVDLMVGGVAVTTPTSNTVLLDPSPAEHSDLTTACVVGYLPSRDEVTELWMKGDLPATATNGKEGVDTLIDSAVGSAKGAHAVLQQAVREAAEQLMQVTPNVPSIKGLGGPAGSADIDMKT